MQRLRVFILGIAVLIGLTASAVTVEAGTNGQQLAFNPGCWSNYAYVQGHNQNWQYVHQWVRVPADYPGECGWYGNVYDYGWWWKGQLRIDFYWGYGTGYNSTQYVTVPTNQGTSNNWFWIGMP